MLHVGAELAAKRTWSSRLALGGQESFRDLQANHLFVVQEAKGIVDSRRFG